MNSWQALYDSRWHHPGVAWLVGAAFIAWLAMRAPRGSLRVVLLALAAETVLDAWLTGGLSPLASDGPWAQPISIAFVIAGDLRLFLLLERFRTPQATWRSALLRAVPLAFVVPVLQAIAIRTWPSAFDVPRKIYLVYEVLFCGLAALLLASRRAVRQASGAAGWYATRLTVLFLAQYGLWVVSDVLILHGESWALGLRLIPNTIYYAAFLVAAARWAPEEAWA